MKQTVEFTSTCPIPVKDYPHVTLAHGGGGRLMHQLIDKMFKSAFDTGALQCHQDAAVLECAEGRLALTTDSFVVNPLEFPGGDIGMLAVNGTVNDLAMVGARPRWISCAFIIEEGLPMDTLWRIVRSMRQASDAAGVAVVTGDTKVVDKGKGDGLFINTSGVGVIRHQKKVSPAGVCPGDAVIVNGDLGRHGIAIMAVREGLSFESAIESDTAALAGLTGSLLEAGIDVHCMRDLTRGGLSSALNEIAPLAGVDIDIDESTVPVREDVCGACEILGLDPLYVANEGRLVLFVPREQADRTLEIMNAHPCGRGACLIGRTQATQSRLPTVTLKSAIGARRVLDMLSGAQLPRIC